MPSLLIFKLRPEPKEFFHEFKSIPEILSAAEATSFTSEVLHSPFEESIIPEETGLWESIEIYFVTVVVFPSISVTHTENEWFPWVSKVTVGTVDEKLDKNGGVYGFPSL